MSTIATTTPGPKVSSPDIWDEHGQLVPLMPAPAVYHGADVAAIVVSRNRPDLVDAMVGQLQGMGQRLTMDVYVVEMGTEPDKLSPHGSLRYEDPDFRGKCYGHNVGLRLARAHGRYRYYWILMNDLIFEGDTIQELIDVADAHPAIAVLSPTEPAGDYPDGRPQTGHDFHLVSTCDYLALLIRAEAVEDVGFLNPDFKYCWGAIHELAYKLYDKGWQVAYCDRVTMKHLGGTTYGQAAGTVSRPTYLHKAKEFAARYFAEHYGRDWDERFSCVLPPGLRHNTFRMHRRLWEGKGEERLLPEKAPASLLIPSFLARATRAIRQLVRPNVTAKAELRRQIDALHPWYYPATIGGIAVTPGIGSRQTPDELRGRVAYRTRLLVDEVARRYDFRGKRLLDIASNCAYFSARYAERGAASLLAIEGRADFVQQGWLYWRHNDFLPPGAFDFRQGNVMEPSLWDDIRARGPFDFTLCAGILYHVPDPEFLLRQIAAVTREAVLIDTRVSDSDERIEEPGGWCFDAIVETRVKTVPRQDRIVRLMTELGFRTQPLSTDAPVPEGLKGNDDYSRGQRIAWLAIRHEAWRQQRGGNGR